MSPAQDTNRSTKHGEARKKQIMSQGRPTTASSVADALVIKDDDVFFLTTPQGDVPLTEGHGFGLYYHDCRYLNGYELLINGRHGDPLVASAASGFSSVFELANPEMTICGRRIPREQIGIKWTRMIDAEALALRDRISFRNFTLDTLQVPITLRFRSAFEDVYEIRGLVDVPLGQVRAPAWDGNTLRLVYDGKDHVRRTVAIAFSMPPSAIRGSEADFVMAAGSQSTHELCIQLTLSEEPENVPDEGKSPNRELTAKSFDDAATLLERHTNRWIRRHTDVRSNSRMLDATITRSLRDLYILRTSLDRQEYFSAGIPWYVALFGRDSIITALETLAFDPEIAHQTLRLLARFQGKTVDHDRDEEPGKILHELRVGELAHLHEIPDTPYYGSADSTPLFLILLARYTDWTGDASLFDELRPAVDAALRWISSGGDGNHGGYIEYRGRSKSGLVNQGWKDSGDAIVNTDGSLATPPISLVEIQGYAYEARRGMAMLYRAAGDGARADQLEAEARDLKDRFNRDFWLSDRQHYALALQEGHRPVAVLASNPGQALWTGIIDADKAQRTADLMMTDDMFTGWGVRTLSAAEKRFNPIGYHLGTVWPHDNALIAAGLRRYGLDEPALRIFNGILGAASHFKNYRLPEVFAGFRKDEYHTPVHYPSACHPQAWAAGSVPHLLSTMLGLAPKAQSEHLYVVRPMLPSFLQYVELRNLRVGEALVHLRFERVDGTVRVSTVDLRGRLEVEQVESPEALDMTLA